MNCSCQIARRARQLLLKWHPDHNRDSIEVSTEKNSRNFVSQNDFAGLCAEQRQGMVLEYFEGGSAVILQETPYSQFCKCF